MVLRAPPHTQFIAAAFCIPLASSTPKPPFLPLACSKIQPQHLEVTLEPDCCLAGAHNTNFGFKKLVPRCATGKGSLLLNDLGLLPYPHRSLVSLAARGGSC